MIKFSKSHYRKPITTRKLTQGAFYNKITSDDYAGYFDDEDQNIYDKILEKPERNIPLAPLPPHYQRILNIIDEAVTKLRNMYDNYEYSLKSTDNYDELDVQLQDMQDALDYLISAGKILRKLQNRIH